MSKEEGRSWTSSRGTLHSSLAVGERLMMSTVDMTEIKLGKDRPPGTPSPSVEDTTYNVDPWYSRD